MKINIHIGKCIAVKKSKDDVRKVYDAGKGQNSLLD